MYADADMELRRPLSSIGAGTAPAVLTPRIATEFLFSEPHYPVLHVLASALEESIETQARLWHLGASRCRNAVQCVVETTGPKFVVPRFRTALYAMGCHVATSDYAYPQIWSCEKSSRAEVRASRVCVDEDLVRIVYVTTHEINMSRGWDCGVARHRNCATRNNGKLHATTASRPGDFGLPCDAVDRERHMRGHYTMTNGRFFSR